MYLPSRVSFGEHVKTLESSCSLSVLMAVTNTRSRETKQQSLSITSSTKIGSIKFYKSRTMYLHDKSVLRVWYYQCPITITPCPLQYTLERTFVCVSVWIFTDVGMMMMQTGMVKQNLNTYRGFLDGTERK